MPFHAMTEHYEEITVCGKPALFTSIRIKRDTVPNGLYAYIEKPAMLQCLIFKEEHSMGTNVNMHSTPFIAPLSFTADINRDPSSLSGSDTHTKKSVPPIPLCEKWLLTIPEASIYFGVGQNRLANLASQDGCKFVVFVGNTKRIKRKKFEEFLDEQYAI